VIITIKAVMARPVMAQPNRAAEPKLLPFTSRVLGTRAGNRK
jgi:hypothetical protein